MDREAEFTAQLWRALEQYLRTYAVGGRKLVAKEPNSVVIGGKVPDIVVTDDKGLPQLIIETKREVEGAPREELLNPLGPAPIAQAVCYASLALEEYGLKRTPLFATANRDALILFKGIDRGDLDKVVDVKACLEPKRRPEDWVKALRPGGLEILLESYIIDRVEHPLKGESLEKLFEYVGKWLTEAPISPAAFYRIFVSQLRGYIEGLHEYVRDAVKSRILNDRGYFVKLFAEAEEMGYRYGLLSRGLLELRCPDDSGKICDHLKEVLEEELGEALEPERAFDVLSAVSRRSIAELCDEARRAKGIDAASIPLCQRGGRVGELISFDNLTRMMTYVLANKILAYKILELHYGHVIPPLEPVRYKEVRRIGGREFRLETPNDLVEMLNYIYSYASSKLEERLGVKDFSPIFRTGLYDEIVLSGVESINRVNAIIELIESWKPELGYLLGIIGYVYEGLLPPSERHQLGQFYTPPAIARLITKWAVRSKDDRVLDAGCGSGTFLIEAYKRLLSVKFNKEYDRGGYPECKQGYNEHQEVLNQLYGVDINAFASHLTSIHLMLMAPKCPISRLNVETRDYFTLMKGGMAFGKRLEGFDAVVGNPPYTRWVEIPEGTRGLINKLLGDELAEYDLRADVARGREVEIYVYWIMHAAKNLLKERGRIGMIVSNAWLQTSYGVDFGRFLLDNFRIVALVDVSFRLFEALISTAIILAEKEPSKDARDNNVVTLIRVPPKIKGEVLDVEKAGGVLDEVLRCIENALMNDGSVDARSLDKCRQEYGIYYAQIRQGDIPRDEKWIGLFFARVEDILRDLEKHPLIVRLDEWFEPSRGNSVWSVRALRSGKRPDLGAKDFFYFSRGKIDEWGKKAPGFEKAVERCLAPAITRSQYVKAFTFTKGDWEDIERSGKNAYIFVCHEPRDSLPGQVQAYVRWGETECRTRIRRTRGGGEVCSEASACRARAEDPKAFRGWYDLGGYIPAPIMAIYQPRYRPQFFLVGLPLVTYHAIIALIPKVRVKAGFMDYNPEDYREWLSSTMPDIELSERDVKALLAYLNSSFVWLWLEQNARYVPKGPLGLEVSVLRRMPLLNVKEVEDDDVEELARLFDELEAKARSLAAEAREGKSGGASKAEGEEEGGEGAKLELFKALEPHFQAIDGKIAEVLGLPIDARELWSHAWEMMERRTKGAKGPARPGVGVSIDIDMGKKGRKKRGGSEIPLTKWFEPEGGQQPP